MRAMTHVMCDARLQASRWFDRVDTLECAGARVEREVRAPHLLESKLRHGITAIPAKIWAHLAVFESEIGKILVRFRSAITNWKQSGINTNTGRTGGKDRQRG